MAQLFPASLAGVPFKVTDISEQGGPYNVLHEYAGRGPSSAYNGPRTDRYTVDAYLIGPDADQQWERLKEVLKRGGAQRLIHPWHGSVMVALDGPYDCKRSTDHLGMVKVSIPFHEAGPETTPALRVDTDELLIADADDLDLATADMFAQDFTVEGSNNLRERSTTIVDDIVEIVRDMNAQSQSQFSAVNSTASQINTFGASVETLLNTPHALASTVAGLIDATYGAITGVADAGGEIDPVGDARSVLSALLRGRQVLVALGILRRGRAFGDDYSTPSEVTPQQRQRALNQRRLVQLVQLSTVSGAARAAARLRFESSTQVQQAFDQITAAIDDVREDVDDATYQALSSTRASLGAHLRISAGQLPQVTLFTPPESMPSTLIAHQLYGDARRADEITERNSIVHPGFVPGGVPIEVLSA